VAKRLLLRVSEGGLQHDTAIVLDLLDHLVRRHLPDKHKQGRFTGMDAFGELLHELVIDAEVRQRAAERTARRSHSRAKKRIKEKNPDQQTPESAPHRAGRRCVDDLVQLDLTIDGFGGDDCIRELDDIFPLQLEQARSHLFRLFQGRIDNNDEIGHRKSPYFHLGRIAEHYAPPSKLLHGTDRSRAKCA